MAGRKSPVSRRTATRAPQGTYHVYVGEVLDLDGRIIGSYVGQTAKTPEQRWAQHRDRVKAARVFKRPDRRPGDLRPDLLPPLPRLTTRAAAEAAERAVADLLRHAGHHVEGGH